MNLYLGGHLSFYHPQKEKWLVVEGNAPEPLADLLSRAGIPLGEVHLVVVNGEVVELENAIVAAQDEVRIFSAVGGG